MDGARRGHRRGHGETRCHRPRRGVGQRAHAGRPHLDRRLLRRRGAGDLLPLRPRRRRRRTDQAVLLAPGAGRQAAGADVATGDQVARRPDPGQLPEPAKTADADNDGKADKPVPMVLLVHGGPWARDAYGYSAYDQWLANRGYAVPSVNYRGSTGFGKDFVNKSNHEWAGKMHDDLIDAVQWAVQQGVTTPDKVAIMGGSYGGYATLVGMTFTPDTFACGVDLVGPSNLVTQIG